MMKHEHLINAPANERKRAGQACGDKPFRVKRSVVAGSLYLLCCMALLPSCEKEDKTSLPEEDAFLYNSYFEGTIDGERFDVKNGDRRLIQTARSLMTNKDGSDTLLSTTMHLNETRSLLISITATMGVHVLESPDDTAGSEENIKFISWWKDVYTGERGGEIFYQPKKDRPFLANVVGKKWLHDYPDSKPAIVAKLKGFLYNTQNPADSVLIDAIYGVQPRSVW
jgi:hypothetical protein